MKRNVIILSVVGVVLVASAISAIAILSSKPTQESQQNNEKSSSKIEQESENMYADLQGEAFDETYLADMLAHHEGAVTMSEMSGAKTNNPEILALSQDILRAQGEEMAKMVQWQEEWGYEKTMGGHASHSGATANDMAGHMMDMTEQLKDLSAEAFDKKFISLMIEHHQQAIDMSVYASSNAYHQEIKDLAEDVITAQQKDINQMKQWQKDWGFNES